MNKLSQPSRKSAFYLCHIKGFKRIERKRRDLIAKWRMKLDIKHANLAIKECNIPVPNVNTLHHKLNVDCVLTLNKLDMQDLFYQMFLGKESRGAYELLHTRRHIQF